MSNVDLQEAPDLFARIRTNYSGLSASFKRVADFMITHYQDAAFFPAAKVAQHVGVSESVVVRFAMYLGYSGFPEMIREVQRYVKAQLSPQVKLESAAHLASMTPPEILQAIIAQDIKNLQETGQDVVNQAFPQVADAFLKAERVYIVGLRGLGHLAGMLGFLLDVGGIQTEVISHGDAHLYEQLRRIGPNDVLVVFAFHRYTRRPVHAIELARSKGAKTVVIADSITAPPAQYADLVLRAPATGASFFNSYTAAVTLINALVSTCAVLNKERTEQSLKELEALLPEADFMTP